MTRRHLLASLAMAAAPGPERPNILVILSDQQHWKALGRSDKFFETPNLDELARTGFTFEKAFCTTPQCSPSRSSLMTGFYPTATGVMGNIGAAGGASLRQPNFLRALADTGYSTGYFGKWHLGKEPVSLDGLGEMALDIDDPAITKRATGFLANQRGATKPFVLMVSYLNPHRIYGFSKSVPHFSGSIPLPESWSKERLNTKPKVQLEFMTQDQGKAIWGKDRRDWEAYREFYRDRVREYDAHVGQCLRALDRAGLAASTIVVASSDHGDMDTHHKLIFKGPFLYEQMVRIPLIFRVPGRTGSAAEFPAVNTDVAPTLLELAGVPMKACDGVSLAPIITGKGKTPRRDYVIGQYYSKQRWVNPTRMIRTETFKYNRYIQHGEELYDLKNDPGEVVNLASDKGYRKTMSELSRLLDRWMADNNDPFSTFKATDRSGRPL
ncbi:MAG TPA: sulfatase-like hydrolase/transferase [Bryobacteraceae bacterium]|nr:sulfatase-like hydrolase/transferase [Bryobacteraceae bacterium]